MKKPFITTLADGQLTNNYYQQWVRVKKCIGSIEGKIQNWINL